MTEDEELDMACDWTDYRAEYGVSPDDHIRTLEHKAFCAGWEAGRHGDRSGVLR